MDESSSPDDVSLRNRRQILAGLGTVSALALAGCGGSDDTGGGNGGDGNGNGGGDTPGGNGPTQSGGCPSSFTYRTVEFTVQGGPTDLQCSVPESAEAITNTSGIVVSLSYGNAGATTFGAVGAFLRTEETLDGIAAQERDGGATETTAQYDFATSGARSFRGQLDNTVVYLPYSGAEGVFQLTLDPNPDSACPAVTEQARTRFIESLQTV
jgi:hypothetical protein